MSKYKIESKVIPVEKAEFVIDYERLADALVRAHFEAKKREKVEKKPKDIRDKAVGFINGVIYLIPAIYSYILLSRMWHGTLEFTKNWSVILRIGFTILFAGLILVCFIAQQKTFDDNSDEVHKYFNININLLSLSVAIMALVIALK
ncbi:MAG: hypothetical protein LLF96_03185 [Eubacteriales bacterium]|nr:hypothetical protein [Eubacteriales bacterium]